MQGRHPMRLGVHVSSAGKIYEAVTRAKALGCNTMQLFNHSPRAWKTNPLTVADAEEFRRRRAAADITPAAVHTSYLVNLASPEAGLWRRSIAAYIEEVQRADRLGIEYLVTHVGSPRGRGEAFGIARVAEALNRVLERTKPQVVVLLENTAGSGDGLGFRFAQLAAMIEGVKARERMGVCLDSAHTFTAGYDLRTDEGVRHLNREIAASIGWERIKLVHLNDSKAPFNSHVDRHWHIGQGHLGAEGIRRVVNHPKLQHLPFVLETPKLSEREDRRNLRAVRALVNGA